MIASGGIPGSPFKIVDVTRSSNGCGGCTKHAMNSGVSEQASWHTSDGAPWFLRDNTYTEPNGDYQANCFLHVYGASNPSDIRFNDGNCHYHSNAYLCQRKATQALPSSTNPEPAPEGVKADKATEVSSTNSMLAYQLFCSAVVHNYCFYSNLPILPLHTHMLS